MNVTKASTKKTRTGHLLQYLLIATSVFAAVWGVVVVAGFMFSGTAVFGSLSHVPFWLMVGSIGVLLNYIPIARAKPLVVPAIGIVMIVVTTLWFCINNLFGIDGLDGFLNRLQTDIIMLVACYCFTHLSLLHLTYRKGKNNLLLFVTGALILLSAIVYFVVFSGVLSPESAFIGIVIAAGIFFAKMALTIALVVTHLVQSKNDAVEEALFAERASVALKEPKL